MKVYDFNYIPVNGDKVDATIDRILNTHTELTIEQKDGQFISQGCLQIYKQTDTDHITNKRQFICDVRKGLGTCSGQCNPGSLKCRNCSAFLAEQDMQRILKGRKSANEFRLFSLKRLLNTAVITKSNKNI